MDRSQEKGLSSQAKLQTLDQSKNIQKAHENQASISRVAQRKISSESSNENLSYVDTRNGMEGVNTRKNEPLISSYLHASNPGMSLPYLASPNMDPRALGSFFYGYNPQMMGFTGYPGIYGQRLTNGEDMRENRSSTSTPADRSDSGRDPKEPVRTESVIKIATDRTDSRKQDSVEKRQARPSTDEYSRHYVDGNGDTEPSRNLNPYRGSRDKMEIPLVTSNGDIRNTTSKHVHETSSLERTVGVLSSYQSPSVYSKSLTPASHPGERDYVHSNQKPDHTKPTTTTSSNMFASMPKLTPIAPRGFSSPNFPTSSAAAEANERQSISGSVWRPPSMGYPSREYPLSSSSEPLAPYRSSTVENLNRNEETSEVQRAGYLPHSMYENSSHSQESLATRERSFPYSWERSAAELASRYPGHSAYQGYGYGRTFQAKRPSDKENMKETEEVRNRTNDSTKESALSPDRSSSTTRHTKDPIKTSSAEVNKNTREVISQNYKVTVTSQPDVSSKNQATFSKNEKPVLPESVRYKVKDERKCALKSDKVTVYPRQGMAYAVSVRETQQKLSDYFSNGKLPESAVTTVSSNSLERVQLPAGYEATNKKDDGQRHGSIRETSIKPIEKGPEKTNSEGTTGGEYPRRGVEVSTNDRHVLNVVEEAKKSNDRNNNSSFGAYTYPGFPNQSERSRAPNRITLSQDKVFVPPNATLEMFEKRELEMERAAASCRSGEGTRNPQFGSSTRPKPPGRKENDLDTRNHSPEQTNPRVANIKPDSENIRGDTSNKSSDDEELKIIEDKGVSQARNVRTEEKRSSSSPRHSRITSPIAPTSSASNPPHLTPFGVNFPPRRTPTDSDAVARENAERNLQAAAYMYGANLPYQTNSPYLGSNVRADMPVMLPVDQTMFYSGLYKQHMMDPSQGGAVMQDPLTGALVVVPEALMNPNVFSPLAESQLMLDPARLWSMQASMEDPRWQQFYQQQKQLYEHQLEKYKHEMMIAQQQGRWPGYSFYPFYQKQMEVQRKEENDRGLRNVEQRPKSREDQTSQPRVEKNEDSAPKEKKPSSSEERFYVDSRREDLDSRWDSSKRTQEFQSESRAVSCPDKPEKVPTRENVKPSGIEEKKLKEKMQQEEQDRQFQQYMLREPVFNPSKFPFACITTSPSTDSSNSKSPVECPRDRPRDPRENSRGESTPSSDAPRHEMSPLVVSAAATLANMDFGSRFPFNQQSSKQLNNQNVRGSELDNTGTKRSIPSQIVLLEENAIHQPVVTGKSPTESKASLSTLNISTQLYSPTTSITAGNPVPNERREQSTDSSASEKGNFDVTKGSVKRETTRTKSNSTSSQSSVRMDYYSNGEEECSRLLVAKAEKLPQDEELEVIRIDTPYAHIDPEPSGFSADKRQDMDLLMSLSKACRDPLESPSSKSDIVWVKCSEEDDEDFEVRTINSSVKSPKSELEGHNKENYFKFSLQDTKSESEKKCIREKIEKLREIAKSRTREERFTALTRQKELKSPSSIVNSVTSSLNEVLDMNVMEKDIRMRLADLQKKYREKHRELARLQPKCKDGNDDAGGGKNTPVKRGPGRPRKRKYFGASSRSGKTTPTPTSNGSVDLTTKSGESSPSSCPQSPGFKSITSEENVTVKEEPAKKKRKKNNTNKVEERIPSLPSPPQIVSPTEIDVKSPRVKPSKKTPTSVPKNKIPTSTVITASTNSSNMAKLISAISPSMLDDTSNMETGSESSATELKTVPTKIKTKKTKKVIKREKTPSLGESQENKEKMSPDSVKKICGSPTSNKIKKIKNPNKGKKKVKQSTTPKTNSEFIFPATSEKITEKINIKKKDFAKPAGLELDQKVEQENNGDSSENDEVFAACHGGGALDMLADFASSASFEKEKQSKRESPFEGLGKGSKRGRPKKPNSPGPETETTAAPKKKKKKKKPSTSSTKSSKKDSTPSEEKENDFTNRELEQQHSPTQILQEKTETKEQSKTEVLEEKVERVVELREEPEEEAEPVMEQEPTPPAPAEPIKEKRRKSRASSVKDIDENKSPFALFSDWQPRRSERIFINSSVAPPTTADSSPLSSPTSKTSDFGWPKKTKRLSKGKKLSKAESLSDAEPTEEEAQATSTKIAPKQKKKKSPAKGKKRRSSSVTDPDFVLRTPKRKASKRDRSYEELDEDDDEDMADEEEEEGEDVEQTSKDNQAETSDQQSQEDKANKFETETSGTTNLEMTEKDIEDTPTEKLNRTLKLDDISADRKDTIGESDSSKEEPKVEDNSALETRKEDSHDEMEKEVSVEKGKEKNLKDSGSSEMETEETEGKKEKAFGKEERKEGQESEGDKTGTLPREEESTIEAPKTEQSSSDDLASIFQEKEELPPEPVISFTKDELKENAKMLLPVDRVFYRGRIAFYQDPDLYGIVLPGERGRRPHLRSTEQLLSQAVKDVIPPAVEYLPVGTRVCAHWSPQYRCFYPGSVIETPPDEKSEVGKLWVEFDDGDSGIFPLSDLRKIKTQYPVQVDDVESDVVVPERRPRSSSRATSPSTRRSRDHDNSLKNKDDDTSDRESSEDAPVRRSKGRGKRRVRLRTRERRLSGEATDSDAPRGSRDSDFEESTDTPNRDNRINKADNDDKDYEAETKSNSQTKEAKRERRRTKCRDEMLKASQDKTKDVIKSSEASENASKDAKKDSKNERSGLGNKEKNKSKLASGTQKQQDEDSDVCDDNEVLQEAGSSRSRCRSSRLSELDLRKKSLTLNLNSPMQDSTSQDEDSGSCSEVFDESPQMENKGFQPRLGKRRRSQLDKSKQDKSQGELWQWSGKNYQNKRKGKGRKVFYKTIVRGDETISVGDCAVFTSNPSKSNNLPYVGMIENMWEGCGGNMVVKVKWFYHPEETKAGRRASDAKQSLYRSTHVDENDVQTISHKCEVVSPEELKRRIQSQETIGTRSTTNDRSERLFCCVGTYDPSTEKIDPS